jgi:hypothetical protein
MSRFCHLPNYSARRAPSWPAVPAAAVVVLVLSACAPHDAIGRTAVADESRESATSAPYSLQAGSELEPGTVVGFHIDLGDDWEHTGGSMGLLYLENAQLGCSLAFIVANPFASFPHSLDDEPGSLAILEQFGPGGSNPSSYLYPTKDGETIEMLSVVRSDPSGSRMAVAREFGSIDSALMADLGCAAGVDIEETFAAEVAGRFPATISLG